MASSSSRSPASHSALCAGFGGNGSQAEAVCYSAIAIPACSRCPAATRCSRADHHCHSLPNCDTHRQKGSRRLEHCFPCSGRHAVQSSRQSRSGRTGSQAAGLGRGTTHLGATACLCSAADCCHARAPRCQAKDVRLLRTWPAMPMHIADALISDGKIFIDFGATMVQ